MSEQQSVEKCKQCDSDLLGQFCANCGHNQALKRINGQFIVSEIASVLNFQKGILFTIKALLTQPGLNIRIFIHDNRNRLVKPISFIILCSLIYIIAQQMLQFSDEYISYSDLKWGNTTVGTMMKWISTNYGFANLLMAIFIAIWIKIFFKKYDYNIFEILILLYFIMGIQMLILTIFGVIDSLFGIRIGDKGSLVAIIYICWSIGRFFDSGKKLNYVKAFFSYILGLISFIIAIVAFGGFIDWIISIN